MDKFEIQDSQYHFPYHYIPYFDNLGNGKRTRILGWGLKYLCYLRHVKEIINRLNPQSILEVGCGDGRLIGLLDLKTSRRVGTDISEKAIRFAKAFHSDIEFHAKDAAELNEEFEAVVAVEVLEHIPDKEVGQFLNTLEKRTRVGGHLIISVPTIVLPTNKKHFRHYHLKLLEKQLFESGAKFKIINVEYIYSDSILTRMYFRLTNNGFWILAVHKLDRIIWNYIWNSRRISDEKHGQNMIVLLRKI